MVYFFLYESSDLTLEKVNEVRDLPFFFALWPPLTLHNLQMYTDPKCKPWTSRRWAPPGYASRRDLVQQVKSAEVEKQLAVTGADENTTNGSANGHSQEHLTDGKAGNGNV